MELEPLANRSAPAQKGYYSNLGKRQLRLWVIYSKIRSHYWGLLLSLGSRGVTSIQYDEAGNEKVVPLAKKVKLPQGPLIVIANQSSHADLALLSATLGRTGRPVFFSASSKYWLNGRLKRIVGKYILGLWPVRRGEEGLDDLCNASEAIKAGAILVIFPEGGRTRNSILGEFSLDAYKLACLTGAKILPIALVNTAKFLPIIGKPTRTPMEVRYGKEIKVNPGEEVDIAKKTREEIINLLQAPVQNFAGFGWSRVNKIAMSWVGLAIVFGWAFGEGVSWPLLAEMPLMLLVVTVGRKWRGALLIGASALGSVLGILTTWYLVSKGHNPPTPLTTTRMHDNALRQMMESSQSAFWYQTYNGIPVKVYAHMAGSIHLTFQQMLLSMAPRILRIFIVGGTTWMLGGILSRFLRPCLGLIQSFCLLSFPFALYTVIRLWS